MRHQVLLILWLFLGCLLLEGLHLLVCLVLGREFLRIYSMLRLVLRMKSVCRGGRGGCTLCLGVFVVRHESILGHLVVRSRLLLLRFEIRLVLKSLLSRVLLKVDLLFLLRLLRILF